MADDVPPDRRVRRVRRAKAQAIPFVLWTDRDGFREALKLSFALTSDSAGGPKSA
jgi:hypothetical protein